MKKIETVVWASNLSQKTGEGILGNLFLKKLLSGNKKKVIEIKTFEQSFICQNNNCFKKKFINKSGFFHKYFGPLYGVYYLWLNHDKNIVYINYLPLWNFIVFLFLPKKTVIGPITGGNFSGEVTGINFFIRKYIFKIFYRISNLIIYKKFKKITFSTDLLKKYISNSKYKYTLFNFVFSNFFLNKKKIKKKDFDLIFYNRNHSTKNTKIRNNIINFLSKYYKICVVGDFFDNNCVKNFGFVNRNKIYNLLSKSKLALSSEENFFSLFVIDAINSNTKILSLNNNFNNNALKKYFFFVKKEDSFPFIKRKIKKIIKSKVRYDSNFKKIILQHQKKINAFTSYM